MTKPCFTKHYKADYKDEYIFLVVIINCDVFKYTVHNAQTGLIEMLFSWKGLEWLPAEQQKYSVQAPCRDECCSPGEKRKVDRCPEN